MGYKKSLFIFMVLSFILFFININYFNDILIFSLNTDSIYYTNENDVFNFRTLNAALFFFISIIPLAITLSISKPNLKRALFFYFIVYLSLFISLSVKKITTQHSDFIYKENYPSYLTHIYLLCFLISSIVINLTSSIKFKEMIGNMDMRLKYLFILLFQFSWYMPVIFLLSESSVILLFAFMLPIIFYNVACLNHFNKNKMIVLWVFIPFIAIFIPFFLRNDNNKT